MFGDPHGPQVGCGVAEMAVSRLVGGQWGELIEEGQPITEPFRGQGLELYAADDESDSEGADAENAT